MDNGQLRAGSAEIVAIINLQFTKCHSAALRLRYSGLGSNRIRRTLPQMHSPRGEGGHRPVIVHPDGFSLERTLDLANR